MNICQAPNVGRFSFKQVNLWRLSATLTDKRLYQNDTESVACCLSEFYTPWCVQVRLLNSNGHWRLNHNNITLLFQTTNLQNHRNPFWNQVNMNVLLIMHQVRWFLVRLTISYCQWNTSKIYRDRTGNRNHRGTPGWSDDTAFLLSALNTDSSNICQSHA